MQRLESLPNASTIMAGFITWASWAVLIPNQTSQCGDCCNSCFPNPHTYPNKPPRIQYLPPPPTIKCVVAPTTHPETPSVVATQLHWPSPISPTFLPAKIPESQSAWGAREALSVAWGDAACPSCAPYYPPRVQEGTKTPPKLEACHVILWSDKLT